MGFAFLRANLGFRDVVEQQGSGETQSGDAARLWASSRWLHRRSGNAVLPRQSSFRRRAPCCVHARRRRHRPPAGWQRTRRHEEMTVRTGRQRHRRVRPAAQSGRRWRTALDASVPLNPDRSFDEEKPVGHPATAVRTYPVRFVLLPHPVPSELTPDDYFHDLVSCRR